MNSVLNVLNDVEGLLSSAIPGVEIFIKSKDPGYTGEYILLDHQPFTFEDVVGNGVVNVHVHVPDLSGGKQNRERLQDICDEVIGLFPDDTFLNGYYVDILSISDSTADEEAGTHFLTIELSITYNNLILWQELFMELTM
ncbi:MAG: hypothetical protein LBV72_19810 [Tannerella sp.]|jgi:hypothetical protein|nr:hypothetical protein [Tannerella sp.]